MLEQLPDQSSEFVRPLLARAAELLLIDRNRTGCTVRLPALPGGRLTLTGDLHDNVPHLEAVLRLAELGASGDNHLILHELIHGERLINEMDFSFRMLVRVADLVVRFPAQVHPLLGNHELAQMRRRAVGKGGGDSVQRFRDALEYVFGEEAGDVEAGLVSFLQAWPIALRTQSGLFCSHSLPAESAMPSFDAGMLRRGLNESDWLAPSEARAAGGGGSAYSMLWGRNHSPAHLDHLARLLADSQWGDVRVFVLGHERADRGWMPVGTRGLVLNSDHEFGVAGTVRLDEVPDRDAIASHLVALQA